MSPMRIALVTNPFRDPPIYSVAERPDEVVGIPSPWPPRYRLPSRHLPPPGDAAVSLICRTLPHLAIATLFATVVHAQQPAAWDVTQPRGTTREIDFTTSEGTW